MVTFVEIIITGSVYIIIYLISYLFQKIFPRRSDSCFPPNRFAKWTTGFKRRLTTLQSVLCNKNDTSRKKYVCIWYEGFPQLVRQIVMLTDVELPSPGKKRVLPDKEVIAVATVDAYLWFHLIYRGDIEGASSRKDAPYPIETFWKFIVG